MRELPTGTVTLLFTDIEGSTKLLYELGDEYATALDSHRRVIREAMADRGGVEMGTEGDAFFYAFARASDAAGGAAAAQTALAAGRVRVRMGLHTGEPRLTKEGYVGLDVHTAARIAGCAHGGQVVLSRRTRELLADVAVTDLGDHRLKDIAEPLRLFQLGDERFPPLRSLSPTTLPQPVSTFVGRERELSAAAEALARARVLTVTGPGGVGKTRFAIALARAALDAYPDGVWWVPLAAIPEPAMVVTSIERAVGAADLERWAPGRRALLLLDNFEHVVAAAPALSPILAEAHDLSLLVTSRELLRIQGEREFTLEPLIEDEGVALFCDRADMQPTDAVRELCQRLEELPLAIELAAARAGLLEPSQILGRLGDRLDLFTGGRDVDPRHSTLRATIGWSHELLDAEEQVLFARLGVFAGGATFEAAEVVVSARPDPMQSLLDKSLLRRTGDRLWQLDTIRAYAVEKLEASGDAAELRDRHARYYLEIAEAAGLWDWAPGEERHDLALDELGNFRAALGWAASGGDAEVGLRTAAALEGLWVTTDPDEGARWFEALLPVSETVSPGVRAGALLTYGGTLHPRGDEMRAEQVYRQSLAGYRSVGDRGGAASVLVRLGHTAWYRGDPERALRLGREGLEDSREAGNPRSEAQALGLIGELEFERGSHGFGLELLGESRDIAGACGFRWWQARMGLRRAKRLRELRRPAEAREEALAGLRRSVVIGDRRRIIQLLDLLALLDADEALTERAGRFRGAIEAELDREPLSAWEMTDLGAATGSVAFARGRAHGLAMPLEAAVREALS
jgi:predicted ATPase